MTSSDSTERLKFSDLNGPYEPSFSVGSRARGCYVSVVHGLLALVVTSLLVLGVALIVYFAGARTHVQCQCAGGGGGINTAGCQAFITAANQCLALPSHCASSASSASSSKTIFIDPLLIGNHTQSDSAATLPLDVRLPTHLLPLHYDVELTPDIYQEDSANFSFSGSVLIRMRCMNATDVIILHINKLTISDTNIDVQAVTPAGGKPKWIRWDEDVSRQFFKLYLASPLIAGEEYLLKLAFTGPLERDLVGLYVSSYKENNQTKWIATTQMQPTDARKAFPCFDEPKIKATFGITMVRKAHMKSISNMPLDRTEVREDGWLADIYKDTVKMSTYLLAFVVCDFEYREKSTANGTLFRVWARPDAIGQVDYALDTGVAILEYFEEYFDIPFPLPKQDMVAIPDFAAGAMENWGLILYRETALLYDPKVSSASNQARVAVVISHELAHQWFGNLVTPSWWDDLWLNEGFASYVEYLGVDHVHPDWKMMDQFITTDVQDVFRFDGLSKSHPIYVPVQHPDQINEIFDRISYGKGASVIRMMNHFLGEHTFRQGLTNYLKELAYGSAHHADLWRALDTQARADGLSLNVHAIMDTWVLQMGYPVVTLGPPDTQGNVNLTQHHFLIDPTQPVDDTYPAPFNYTWQIPFTFTTFPNPSWENDQIYWMDRNNISVQVGSDMQWIMGNLGQYGYYRVNYPEHNWELIIQQLLSAHTIIPVKNRAQILDDAFQLGRAGLIDQLIGLKLTEYLSKETEYLPWEAASTTIGFLDTMFSRSRYYGAFKKYMSRKLKPQYERLGFEITDSTPHLQKYLKVTILAYSCKYGNPDCLRRSSELFQQWMDNPDNNTMDPNLKSVVYCNALKNGGEKEWDFAYEQFVKANVATEKNKLMYALACTQEPWLLSRFLSWTLNSERIRGQDATFAIVYVARNPIGRALTWDFIRSHWERITESFVGFFRLSSLISGVTSSLNTDFELSQLQYFRDKHPDLGASTRAFEQAVEKTITNVRWMKENEDKIGEWLKSVTHNVQHLEG